MVAPMKGSAKKPDAKKVIVPKKAAAKASAKVTAAKSSAKTAAKSTPKVPAAKSTPKVAAAKSTAKVTAAKSTPKVTAAKASAKVSPAKASVAKKSTVATSSTKTVKKTASKGNLAAPAAPAPAAPAPAPAADAVMVKKILRGSKIPVDEFVAGGDKYRVHEDSNATWACMLNQSNVGHNNNKFYVIQVLVKDGGYFVFTRWGRVGVPGQQAMQPCGSVMNAISMFESKFRDKTGISGFQQRHLATPRAGKYALIEMDYEAPDATDADKNVKIQASKLHKKVQELIKLICDVDMMKKALVEVGYDAKKMPLGKISPGMVTSGFNLLQEIACELKAGNRRSELERLSGEFYTVIPHDFGFKKMSEFIIDTSEKLKNKILLVESLKEVEIAHKLLGQKGKKEANPLDTNYANLKCGLTPLDEGCEEWSMVEEYAKNTHGATHSNYKLKLRGLYEVDKDDSGKFSKFTKSDNRQLLWHGSRLTNWVGILGQGLRIAPPEAPVTGYMFGKGVYFADCISKSANYCCTSRGQRGLLLLCEVALGNMNEKMHSDYHASKLPAGKLSTKGIGRYAPSSSHTTKDGLIIPKGKISQTSVQNACLQYNEFIVYDTAQIRLKYLCEFDFC